MVVQVLGSRDVVGVNKIDMEGNEMVVQVLGYRNGVGVNKNTGEQYRYVNTYVAFPADSVEGLQTEKLFMKVKEPLYLIPGHYYELETDMYFFNGQAQVRPCGFKELPEYKGF